MDADRTTSKIPENIDISVGDNWDTDELYVRAQMRDYYKYATMCHDSRFIVAADMSDDDRLQYDATDLFRKSVRTAKKKCRVLTSDRLQGFKDGFRKVFAEEQKLLISESDIYHICAAGIRKRHINSNRRERLNGIIKARIKTARGFDSENPALLGLFITFYNFLRPHKGLGGITPAEKLGIRIAGPSRWAALLAFASTL